MKLKPLEPKFEATLTSKLSKKISSKFRYKIVDDFTIPIICHHLNGNKSVGITKPEGKHRNATSNPNDTKETWNSLDARHQSEILNYFVNSMSFSSEVFPQHFKGLRLFEE